MTEQNRGKGSGTSDPKRASEAGKAGGQSSGNPKDSSRQAAQPGQKAGQQDRNKPDRH